MLRLTRRLRDARWLSRCLCILAGHACNGGNGWRGVGARGGRGRVTLASVDGRRMPAHQGQGAGKATCTLRRYRRARTSSRAASHARAVASCPARGDWCCGGCGGTLGAGNTAYHTANTLGIKANAAPAAACRSGGVARGVSRQQSGLHAIPPVEVGGPRERGCHVIPLAEGLLERLPRHCQALGNAPRGRHLKAALVAVQWRKHPMRTSSKLRRLGSAHRGRVAHRRRSRGTALCAGGGGGAALGSHG